MLSALKSIAFTMTMAVLMIIAGLRIGSHRGPASPELFERVGFSPWHLIRGPFLRVLRSAFYTAGGAAFYISLLMLIFCVSITERVFGNWQTAGLFWSSHLITLLVTSFCIAIPLHRMRIGRGALLATAHDVGPSAGYYGCLGAYCHSLDTLWRVPLIGLILASLGMRVVWSSIHAKDHGRNLSADVSHAVAFPLGVGLAQFLLHST